MARSDARFVTDGMAATLLSAANVALDEAHICGAVFCQLYEPWRRVVRGVARRSRAWIEYTTVALAAIPDPYRYLTGQ